MDAERQRKAALGLQLKAMKESPAYQAVLQRIEIRCGKFWKGWVVADEAKAKALREIARSYLGFDQLVDELIHEGATAAQILQGDAAQSSPGNTDKE